MKAGIIGYGLAGRYFHGPTLLSAGFHVTAICARSLEKKAAAQQDFPGAVIVNSIDELVAEDLDLIVVASPNEFHSNHALAAIEAGINTVVDKPMGRDYYETLGLYEAAEQSGALLTVFFNRLWDSDSLTIKKIIKQGDIGNIFRLESRFERFRPELNPLAWRESTSQEAGGGLLLDLQSHLVSTALDWFGPAELAFSSVRSVRGASDDDVLLVLKHENGVDSYLSASAVSGKPGPKIRLNGDKASLVISELDKQEEILRKGFRATAGQWMDNDEITSNAKIHKGSDSFSYRGEPGFYPAFYNEVRVAIEFGGELPVSRELSLNVARIIDQARQISIR
ncbi:MAG: gfo/Idh/MocA family oxidoreductase [Actinobacteria bacterium]|nr:gfo/Idh/MocA family oxidoreductase [Actinomycetota bacterium]